MNERTVTADSLSFFIVVVLVRGTSNRRRIEEGKVQQKQKMNMEETYDRRMQKRWAISSISEKQGPYCLGYTVGSLQLLLRSAAIEIGPCF
jgi:hypothetical protein